MIKGYFEKPQDFKIYMNFAYEKNRIHEICPYAAMFPPKLATALILKYSKPGDKVYDPFSGRGTTLLEARLNNRIAYASDLNPLAFVISKSKSIHINYKKILKRVDELEKEYKTSKVFLDKFSSEYMNVYFSKNITKQLIFLKNKLGINYKKNNNIDNYILANLLGILHGPIRKDKTSMFCSLGMSNTTAMSRNYVKKYSTEHNLTFPINENVFEKLRWKIQKTVKSTNPMQKGKVKIGDALKADKIFPNTKFDLVLTSPPYLNIFSYTRENWIRLWLLGFDKVNLSNQIKLDDNHRYEEYKKFILNFLHSIKKVLKPNGKLIMVVGDVRDNLIFLNMWNEIKNNSPFTMTECFFDDIQQSKKSTNKNGIKAGKATKVDNICVCKLKYE